MDVSSKLITKGVLPSKGTCEDTRLAHCHTIVAECGEPPLRGHISYHFADSVTPKMGSLCDPNFGVTV